MRIRFVIIMSLALALAVIAGPLGEAMGQSSRPADPGSSRSSIAKDRNANIDKFLKSRGRVTLSEKQAAGARARALGVAAAVNPLFPQVDADGHWIPDYFGVANWAWSPQLPKFVDPLPSLGIANPDVVTFPGSDYYEIALRDYSQAMHSSLPPTKLRGYVQLNNGTGNLNSATNPTGCTPPGAPPVAGAPVCAAADNTVAPAPISYLGPVIIAKRDRPVRVKFVNQLNTGTLGNLFVPVDTTVMGAGMGPDGVNQYTQNRATIHLHGGDTVWISDGTPHQWITPANENTPYPQGVSVRPVPDMADSGDPTDGVMTFYYTNAQSARLQFYHDHAYGITRLNVYAGEAAGYVITDAVESDLIDGTNTTLVNPGRLKVLPDLGVPLVIQDKTFVDETTIAATDPTWVDPSQTTFGTRPGAAVRGDLWYPHVYIPNQNPWDPSGAGGNGFGRWDYGPWFYPPVPTTALVQGPQPNPYCLPTPPASPTATTWDCSQTPWEAPFIPGVPSASAVMEAFMDTPVVNGVAFPYMEVEARPYRFRILNACNDRFLNLQLYKANKGIVGSLTTTPGSGYTADPVVTVANAAGDVTGRGFTLSATADLDPASLTFGQVSFAINSVGTNYTSPPVITVAPAAGDTTGAGATATAVLYGNVAGQETEVGMIPFVQKGFAGIFPNFDVSGVPDPSQAGPSWWQIGTEGGFLPAPVLVPNQHITWNLNPRTFNFGTVLDHALLLGSAERADVIVDFSSLVVGDTIILYNDAPAAFPAMDPRLDYYTNSPDQTATGGAPSTPPGVGPNTRTIMQFRVVAPNPGTYGQVNLANLRTVWAKAIGKKGVFEASQDPIIIPQAAYNSAYNATYTTNVANQYIQIAETSKTFQPINIDGVLQSAVTVPIEEKAIHDEMGGVYDDYGRMSGFLGLSLPATTSRIAQFLPYGYASPPVDLISGSVRGSVVGSLNDGTQIWRITQNGVDTHPIHIHLTNAQLINRVGWDGMMIPPDPAELGWKETFRVNPLEQTFIAMRPSIPQVPFHDQVPNSVRLIDPTKARGVPLNPPPPAGWSDTNGRAIGQILNHEVNFGWEYVYHCHILAHEEMDMMHSLNLAVPPAAPSTPLVTTQGTSAILTWTDNSSNETGFIVEKSTNNVNFTKIGTLPAAAGTGTTVTFKDPAKLKNRTIYYYRVYATNVIGDTATPGFPTKAANSTIASALPLVK